MLVRRFIFCLAALCAALLSVGAYCADHAVLDDDHEALIEITDSHGKYKFAQPPTRFVSLNWALTEQLLDLDEMPLGIADLADFHRLSPNHKLDNSVVDLGPRLSPDLESIKALKPEVIFIGYSQRSLLRPLSNIATVVYFKNFGRRYNNAEKAKDRLKELAKLFRKIALAENRLQQQVKAIDALTLELSASVKDIDERTFALLAPSQNSGSSFALFGENSMPYVALTKLGLTALTPDKTNGFGIAQLSAQKIGTLIEEQGGGSEVCLVIFDRYAKINGKSALDDELAAYPCQFSIEYQQAFGGALSVGRLAESFVTAFRSTGRTH